MHASTWQKILSYAVLFLDDSFVQIYLILSYLEFMKCIGEVAQKPKVDSYPVCEIFYHENIMGIKLEISMGT